MRVSIAIAALAAAGLTASATGAAARPLHHHRLYAYHHHGYGYAPFPFQPYRRGYPTTAGGYDHGPGYGYPPYGYPGGAYGAGQIIENATIRAQHEPGVTSELAPDAKQTATGGPVGGVPGFSGF